MGCIGTKVGSGTRPEDFINHLKLNATSRLIISCHADLTDYLQQLIRKKLFGYTTLVLVRPTDIGDVLPTDMVILVYIEQSHWLVENYNQCRENRKLIVISRELLTASDFVGMDLLSICSHVVVDDIRDSQ